MIILSSSNMDKISTFNCCQVIAICQEFLQLTKLAIFINLTNLKKVFYLTIWHKRGKKTKKNISTRIKMANTNIGVCEHE